MPSELQRRAVERLIARATGAGLDIPVAVSRLLKEHDYDGGALTWTRKHPHDDEIRGCCWGEVISGPVYCRCWEPVYDVVQQDPCPPGGPGDVEVRAGMCEDCAYRPRSPERQEPHTSEALLGLAGDGDVFWCHQGMRRPVRWEHPDGRTVDASPDDYRPPIVGGVPYQVDGRPGLLCAGWAALARYQWQWQ